MKVHHRLGSPLAIRHSGRSLLVGAWAATLVALTLGCSAGGGEGATPEQNAGSGDRGGNDDGVAVPQVLAPVPRPGVTQGPPPNVVVSTGEGDGVGAADGIANPATPTPAAIPSAAAAAAEDEEAEDEEAEDEEAEDEEAEDEEAEDEEVEEEDD